MKWAIAALFVIALGCVKPPNIVMVDRGTVLEQQAAGSYDDLERQLERAAIEPKPAAMTPEQLDALGMRAARTGVQTDADRIDAWLVQHCIGEGADGVLVQTPDACRGAPDSDEMARGVARVNHARFQLWRWMHAQREDVPLAELRRSWHALHLAGVTCGAWIQGDDGQWHAKAC